MIFLCKKKKVFLYDFKKCENCKDKDICVIYKYELKFQEKNDA